MRVTCAVREYVRKAVLAKVADRLKAAEEAAEEAKAANAGKIAKAKELCEKLSAEAQAKFVKEAKKLGLTFIADTYGWDGDVNKGDNRVVIAQVDSGDFVETVSRDARAAKYNPSAERERFYKLVDEPQRIKEAAEHAADKLLFELELGKVAKKELDGLLKELEVEL